MIKTVLNTLASKMFINNYMSENGDYFNKNKVDNFVQSWLKINFRNPLNAGMS